MSDRRIVLKMENISYIYSPQPSGWRIIEMIFDYLTVWDVTRFDNAHKLASLLKGIRRQIIVRSD